MDEKNYIQILEDSLSAKVDLLRRLTILSQEQAEILKDPNAAPDAFEKNIEEKAKLIERLSTMDQGFDSLFAKVEPELLANKDKYKDSILRMQELIRQITSRSTSLQVLEQQNKELAKSKFAQVRTQSKEIRQNSKAVSAYYQNMMKLGTMEPQFMDRKK